jgi:hypothetical protein
VMKFKPLCIAAFQSAGRLTNKWRSIRPASAVSWRTTAATGRIVVRARGIGFAGSSDAPVNDGDASGATRRSRGINSG